MLIDFSIYKYPELEGKICFTSLGNLVIKKNVSKDDYNKYLREKYKTEAQEKYVSKLHRFDELSNGLKHRVYFYYIPADIYPYMIYKNNKIVQKAPIPERFQKKIDNCSKYIEIDLNYLNLVMGCNFICSKKWNLKCHNKWNKPIIVIKKSRTNRISIYKDYNTIKKIPYIENYDDNLKKEKSLLKTGYMH